MYRFFSLFILATAIGGWPKPELSFLPGRLRWTLLPEERYGNSHTHLPFQLGGGHFTTVLLPPPSTFVSRILFAIKQCSPTLGRRSFVLGGEITKYSISCWCQQ